MTTAAAEPKVLDNLTEDEAHLFALLSDPSGLDQAEFLWVDDSGEDNLFCPHCGTGRNGVHLYDHEDLGPKDWSEKYPAPSGCFRAWAYQWPWWRDQSPLSIDQCARSVGKSLSIKVRGCAFPWLFPGQEMSITAPELVHLEPIVSLIESQMYATRALRELLPRGKSAVTHRPFQMNFLNGARLIGRIPQRDGKGVKGIHPIWLEMDECLREGTFVLTDRGQVPIEDVSVGDRVWTHRGRWRSVTAVLDRGTRPTVTVRGQGHPGLACTPNHQFWARRITRWTAPSRSEGPVLADPEWIDAGELDETFWASPKLPNGLSVPDEVIPKAYQNSHDIPWRNPDFLWLLGLFVAEGSLSSSYGTGGKLNRCYWSIHVKEVEQVLLRMKSAGLEARVSPVQNSAAAANVLVTHEGLASWLERHVGRGARTVSLPSWIYSLDENERSEVLAGVVYGDGFEDPDPRYAPGRWKISTASRALAIGLRLLAQSVGYHSSLYESPPRRIPSVVRGRPISAGTWYQVVGNRRGQGRADDLHRWTRVRAVTASEPERVFDLSVEDDHSFVAEGVVVHNCQDYPHAGWVELRETLKRGFAGAMLRAHGVTKGVHDDFYEVTQDTPDNKWRVHRFAAMWRPNWTDAERDEAVQKYGSRDDPDYRRNVLGLHGDKMNPIFVLTQLMKCVDSEKLSDYNSGEYFLVRAKSEQLELLQQEITDQLDFPHSHLAYAGKTPRERAEHPKAIYWCGMDIGFTIDPSEILVFVEYRPKANSSATVLKLLTRISMTRMPHREQIQAIMHTIDFYRPQAFAMDKAGNGLTIFQEMSEHLAAFREGNRAQLPPWMHRYDLGIAITAIKGYNFSEKLLVDFDPAIELSPYDSTAEVVAKAGMKRNAKEYGTDVLRELVDRQGIWLPWDDDLLKQFQGGTWASNRSMDAYGRRIFSKGNDHVLDAARMMALGWSQNSIEELTKQQVPDAILDIAVSF